MNTLDPAVLEATGQAPSANDVTRVTPHDADPAWSVVEYVDGRTETMPTSEASALPQAPPSGPPLPPEGPPLPPPVGAGNPTTPDAGLPPVPEGFHRAGTPVDPSAQPGMVPAGPDMYSGDSYRPAGSLPDSGLEATPATPGVLPPPQVDPGATLLGEPGAAPGGLPGKTTDTLSENQTVADPADVMANTVGTANDAADQLDAQARGQQVAQTVENQANLEANAARQQQVQDDLRKAEIHTEEAQRVVKVIEDTPIEEDFFKDSPGRQVAAWVALALSGFLQGATRGANPALNQMMQAMQHAQDRFISNQKENKSSKLAARTRELGDAKAAEASMRMQMGKLFDDHAKLQAKQYGLEALPPAISATGAQIRVKGAEQAQAVGMHVQSRTEHRFEQERQAATPQFQGDRDLAALGVDPKVHREQAMDPKGANLGGMVQGAQRLQHIAAELQTIADRHGGDLPHQNLVSWDTIGASKLAGRAGSDSAKDQIRARALIEEAKLAFKSTINIKSVDSENEGKNFNTMMDTGEPGTTLQAIQERAAETNQRAVTTASGFSRNPQAYIQFIERGMSSNPGVTQPGTESGPKPKRSTGYRAAEPAADAPAETTGEAPATRPLAPTTGSRPGSYQRRRKSNP